MKYADFQKKNSAYKYDMRKIPKLSTVYQLCIFQKLYIVRQTGPILILIINVD